MRVLVTGAGGFIGSHLVDSQLAHGHKVRAVDLTLDRLSHTATHPGLEVVSGSILDATLLPELVDRVDVVYHLASAHLDVSLPDDTYFQVNVDGTRNLADAAHASGVRRFVHVSTNAVVGRVTRLPVNETTPCHPTNIYEESKLLGERELTACARNNGLSVIVIRPGWVYGPRCPRTERLLRTIARGRFVMFGRGLNWRHPVYISDAIQALELAASVAGLDPRAYLIAGDKPITIQELIGACAEVLNVSQPSLQLPIWLGKIAGYGAEWVFKTLGKRPPISRRTLDFFIKDQALDISKAKRDLGYQPHTELREGLQKTVASGSLTME